MQKLDELILQAIERGIRPLYDINVHAEAQAIASNKSRDVFRVIDRRLQTLRKTGKIKYLRQIGQRPRWVINTGEDVPKNTPIKVLEALTLLRQHSEWLSDSWSSSPEGREYKTKFDNALATIASYVEGE